MSNSEQHSTFWMGKLLERIVAITVLLCFFLTTCLGDVFIETCHAGVQTALDVESFAKSLTNLSDCADFDIGTFVLPRNLGQVNDLWEATLTNGGQETSRVIHIQDAHCNYEAQQKIAEIIEYFQKTYGVDTVNLEGGEGAYNLSLFTDILDRVVRKKVSDYFVSQGIVNGAEFFAINNHIKEKEVTLWGVEDTTLYVENLKIYRNFLEHKNTAETYLNQLDSLLDNLKHNIYSKEFLEFDAKYIEYKEDKLDVKDYIPYLFQKAIEKDVSLAAFPNVQILFQSLDEEKNINFERANKEREVLIDSLKKKLSKNSFKDLAVETIKFKEGQTSNEEFYNLLINKAKTVNVSIKSFPEFQKYIRYIAVYNAMDKALLMDELENLESEIKEKLYKRDKERELDLLSKHLVLTKNLMNIRLTQKDYEYYKEHEKQFNVKHYLKFIRKEAPRYGINAEPNQSIYQFDVWREKLAAFYEYSFKRDKAFLKNLKFSSPSAGENREKQITILITGGFHSENLTKLFKEKNISYVSIMPNFKNGKDYESQYFSLLSGKKFETLKNLTAEVSSLALYSDFCKNVITVYSLDEIEAKKLWVKLTRAVFEDKKDIVIHNRHYSFQPIEGVLPIEGLEIDGKKVYAKNIGSRSSSNDTNLDTWQETDVALSAEKSRGNAFSSLKKMLIMPFIGGILAKARLADAASLEIIVENFGKVSWAWWVAGGILLLTAGIFAHYVIQNRNKSIQLRSKNELQEKDEEDLDLLDEEDEDIDVSPGFAGAFSSLVYKLARKLENAQEDLTLEINCSDSKNPQGNAALPKGLKLNRYEQEQISDYLDKLIEGDIKKNLMGIKDLAGKGLLPPKMTIRFSNSLVIQREESIITLPKLLFKSLATLKYILVSEFASEGMIGETALTFFRGLTWREQEEIIFY
ncbi:MAG: hypothetical protein KJ864_03780, partial [Candidatus Omnitrophica bacterium]|nr:hypothetical protein [Candidatus Omnitrophota bacterium]